MSSDTVTTNAAAAHDAGAERSVLGLVLIEPDAIAEARRRLKVEDFYNPQHQAIFTAASRLDDDRKPIEPVSILSEMTRAGDTKSPAETAVYLSELAATAPAAASLDHYASLVRDAATRRALAHVGLKMQELAKLDGADNPAEIVERMRSDLDNLAVDRLGTDIPLSDEIVRNTLEEIDALARGGAVMGIPTGFHELDTALNGLRPGQMIVVAARPGVGKALSVDTPIPTPSGWTTMGELEVGDFVLGRDGKPTMVTAATEIMHNRDCYEVHFSDGSMLLADADHQWITDTHAERKARREQGRTEDYTLKASRTTAELINTFRATDGRLNHAIRVASALDLPDAELPIHPYVLGAWIGDGTTSDSRFYTADAQMLDNIREAGFQIEKTGGKDPYEYRILKRTAAAPADKVRECTICGGQYTARSQGQVTCSIKCGADARRGLDKGAHVRDHVPATCDLCGEDFTGFANGRCSSCHQDSLKGDLRDLGVLDQKHIPQAYLRASIAQRRELLAGLLDTDGSGFETGRAEYYTTKPEIAHGVFELVASLGYRPKLRTKRVKGRTPATSTAFTISFTTADQLFKLDRKAAKHQMRGNHSDERLAYRYITAIKPVDSVPVRCIQVDNDEHLYLAGHAMIPTHNTALALDIVRHAAFKQNKSVMFFSLEMSRNELMMRALAAEAYVDLQSLKTGDLDEHKWQQIAKATQRIAGGKLGVDDNATITITDIRAKARAFQRVHGLDLIVIDYLQLMNADRRSDSRQQEVSDISRGVKLLAKEFGVPVIALSQLNRGSEQRQDKKPVISDLRESGAIEQDSDVVILLHREEVYEKESPRAGEADVIIAKQRSGPTGTVILSWLGKYSRFDNRSI